MSEVLNRYSAIADNFEDRLLGITAEKWSAQSPCADWATRDVVVHVINVHRRVRASLDGTTPDEVKLDSPDLLSNWRDARESISSSLADTQLAGKTIGGMFGEQPFESLVSRLLCADTLVHAWDIARATGQDEKLNPNAITKAFEFLLPLDESIRRPGGFAPKIEPAPDSDEQTRFLNFCGRSV